MMKSRLRLLFVLLAVFSLLVACNDDEGSSDGSSTPSTDGDTIKIGLLTELSGSGATFGPGAANVSEMAVEEINEAGGVLGKDVELIIGDSASDTQVANEQAQTMYDRNEVEALFLMTDSGNREAVMPLVEKSEKLAFYTPIYEGGGYQDYMYFAGEVPIQQIEPVIPYLIDEFDANKWYIVGNDYVWATETSEVLKEQLEVNGAELVGEDYVPLGTSEFSSIIARIKDADPDFISVQVIGSDGIAFVKQLEQMGLSDDVRLFGYNIDEDSIKAMGEGAVGMLEAASYFHNLDTPENKDFLDKYYDKFGEDAPSPNFVSNSPYEAIHLWANAVNDADSLEVEKVNESITKVSYSGPKGEVSFEADSHHATLPIYLGEVQSDSEIKVIKELGLIEPD